MEPELKEKISQFIISAQTDDLQRTDNLATEIIDLKLKGKYDEIRSQLDESAPTLRLNNITNNTYSVKFGQDSVGYVEHDKDKGYTLKESLRGQPTAFDERLKPLYGESYPTNTALQGKVLARLK